MRSSTGADRALRPAPAITCMTHKRDGRQSPPRRGRARSWDDAGPGDRARRGYKGETHVPLTRERRNENRVPCVRVGLVVFYGGIYSNVMEIHPRLDHAEAEVAEGMPIRTRQSARSNKARSATRYLVTTRAGNAASPGGRLESSAPTPGRHRRSQTHSLHSIAGRSPCLKTTCPASLSSSAMSTSATVEVGGGRPPGAVSSGEFHARTYSARPGPTCCHATRDAYKRTRLGGAMSAPPARQLCLGERMRRDAAQLAHLGSAAAAPGAARP